MKLFISHSEKDKNAAKALVKLLYGLRMREADMFCSSTPELSIPIKQDIYQYLRHELDTESLFVVFLLSGNYYSSAACLNEMGAAWIKQHDYISILLPKFHFEDIKGAINANGIAISFEDDISMLKDRLNQLRKYCEQTFALEAINDTHWENIRDEFIQDVRKACFDGQVDLTHSLGVCVDDVLNDGCAIDYSNRSKTEVTATIDFSKTSTKMCSLVISPEEHDWRYFVQSDRSLSFSASTTGDIREFILEFNIPSSKEPRLQKHFSYPFDNIKVRLTDFNLHYTKWSNVKEINFLVVNRGNVNSGNLTIKDMQII